MAKKYFESGKPTPVVSSWVTFPQYTNLRIKHRKKRPWECEICGATTKLIKVYRFGKNVNLCREGCEEQ